MTTNYFIFKNVNYNQILSFFAKYATIELVSAFVAIFDLVINHMDLVMNT